MTKRGKKYKQMIKDYKDQEYNLDEAIKKAKETSYTKFPGSIELHFAMTLPKDKEAKSIKGSFALPHPVKTEDVKIIVFCEKDQVEKAKKADAVEAGLDDLIKKIQDGWMDFDIALAVPSVMPKIAVLGRQLGPKGLMPNPKTGTLVEDVAKAIGEFKKGKTKFACDEGGVVHLVVGKVDTDDKKIQENIATAIKEIATVIGKSPSALVKSVALSATMGAGVKVATSFLTED